MCLIEYKVYFAKCITILENVGVDALAEKKTALLNTRIQPRLKARILAVEARHGVPAAVMIEDSMTALCEAVERAGVYRRPMHIVFTPPVTSCECPPPRIG
jgi:hypothetical protein